MLYCIGGITVPALKFYIAVFNVPPCIHLKLYKKTAKLQKQYKTLYLAILVAYKKTHTLCLFLSATKKINFLFGLLLPRSSAVPLAIFPPETPGISLLRNHPSHVAIWAPDPYMKACLWNIKSV